MYFSSNKFLQMIRDMADASRRAPNDPLRVALGKIIAACEEEARLAEVDPASFLALDEITVRLRTLFEATCGYEENVNELSRSSEGLAEILFSATHMLLYYEKFHALLPELEKRLTPEKMSPANELFEMFAAHAAHDENATGEILYDAYACLVWVAEPKGANALPTACEPFFKEFFCENCDPERRAFSTRENTYFAGLFLGMPKQEIAQIMRDNGDFEECRWMLRETICPCAYRDEFCELLTTAKTLEKASFAEILDDLRNKNLNDPHNEETSVFSI